MKVYMVGHDEYEILYIDHVFAVEQDAKDYILSFYDRERFDVSNGKWVDGHIDMGDVMVFDAPDLSRDGRPMRGLDYYLFEREVV